MRIDRRARHGMEGAGILMMCALLASSIEGCTAIGFAVGAAADSRAGKGGPELLLEVKAGRQLTLFLRDGRRLEGQFVGWSRDSGAASPAAERSPLPGEHVTLATRTGEAMVHTDEISWVSVSVSRGKLTGLAAGAAADALALLIAAYAMGQIFDSMNW